MLGLILIEFALFAGLLLVIALMFRGTRMTQDDILAKLATLDTAIKALIARVNTPPVDLTPTGTAIDAIQAEVTAANPPAA